MLLKIQNFNLQSIFDTSFGLASDGDVLSAHPLWKMNVFLHYHWIIYLS
jgi:hypothetical protein